jgi:hypothetical protein
LFPLLPALLLLILQGPSSIEKMALEGRLPAVLEAMSRQMESDHHSVGSSKVDEAVLASFLAFSGNPSASHALYTLLCIGEPSAEPKKVVVAETQANLSPSVFDVGDSTQLPAGHAGSQRSRDGPF